LKLLLLELLPPLRLLPPDPELRVLELELRLLEPELRVEDEWDE